jgi:hypothetical protein
MKTKRELAIEQIELQEKMQRAGINLVTCGNCGSILLHELRKENIECFCGQEMSLSDCPDYWYEGCQDNAEFEEISQ